ncbi:GDP-mannose pyrophosphatase NudK [Saccharospirillum mangrovi]|uniref:GDP-mannose pyrophosphatase NudK n=1 Tax=Saccharospirillum mangrovi TaxID=2161747 RepID=UPI000D3D88D3|nr:GDP-mannose pyrophosphatase NudK [Saccharospirillum mangrovi]
MNNKVRNLDKTLLSDNWYHLYKYRFDYQRADGQWETQEREAYDRGNGATILLFNRDQQSVILTRQFRLPTYINGNTDGMLIETCAGLLDQDNPEDCIRREAEEETGYRVSDVQKVFEAYMSPGSVTELVHFFIAEYHDSMKVSDGGGLVHEQENIEVLEMPFTEALARIDSGDIKDGKTIMLLHYLKLKGMG